MRADPLIEPSILSADFARLAEEVERVAPATDWVHVDVMDAHYVPNLTIGLPVVSSLRKATPLSLDCHLMIEDPDRWAPMYAETADSVTIHVETARDRRGVGRAIRDRGARAGIAVDKQTDVRDVLDVLPDYDMVLVMTIQAGFGGQALIPELLDKVRTARAYLDEHGLDLWLQVDGGVSRDTIEACAEAGADAFVAGNAVYGAADPAQAVRDLHAQAKAVRARAERR
ncbi:MAG TPA: ribulose-phosphate 3-epimerase [Mycobacteriales bacterium]|nr:ribulose-phosphate 3-epimerase [Mycobacteriales bacterium]